MRVKGRKFAITGAGRGLGAALAVAMSDEGGQLVLLARSDAALRETASRIQERGGPEPARIFCDLADPHSAAAAGSALAEHHPDLDGIIHNAAMWSSGAVTDVSEADIQACIGSAAIGALILTRRVLPHLLARPAADIHIVVSTSGLPNQPLDGGSVAFHAAKSAQAGLAAGLYDELRDTSVRVTAVFPGDIAELSPDDPLWRAPAHERSTLTTREVVDAILFMLNLPAGTTARALVIE